MDFKMLVLSEYFEKYVAWQVQILFTIIYFGDNFKIVICIKNTSKVYT